MKYESAVESSATRTLIAGDDADAIENQLPMSKRILDIVLASALFVFLSPVMLIIGALIKLQDGGSMFFIQSRRGRGGVYFLCMKFRTMRPNADELLKTILETDPEMAAEWEENQKFKKDPRVTFIGQFLRRTSLDELPQLLNIIRGEMSIVGPRPIIDEEVVRYGDQIKAYDSVRPGVTGLWQVNGRSDTSYKKRVAFDAEYAADVSVWKDLWILVRTIPAVLFARGAI